jgi:hypothetical protein
MSGSVSASFVKPGQYSDSRSFVRGRFYDTVTITSSTLSIGTPVDLLYTVALRSTIVDSRNNSIAAAFISESNPEGNGGLVSIRTGYEGTFPPVSTLSGVVHHQVGDTFKLWGVLWLDTQGGSDCCGTTYASSVTADASYYVESLTSGATYSAAVSYAPAVPEPEVFEMLLAGLGLIGLVASRGAKTRG